MRFRQIICAIVTLLLLTGSGALRAETTVLPIPGEKWSISFDCPPLSGKKESQDASGYKFAAQSGRFMISLFVEPPQGPGREHKDTYAYYWPLASRNPMIAKESVVVSETPHFFHVQYDMLASVRGRRFRDRNVNYYVAYGGKWIDVHISILEPTPPDDKIFSAFDSSLQFLSGSGANPATNPPPAASPPGTFVLPQHGKLLLKLPPNWKQTVQQPPGNMPPTIRLSPDQGDEFLTLITPLWSPNNDSAFNQSENVKRFVEKVLQRMLPGAVEKNVPLQEFKAKEGTGYYFFVTDKAPNPGEYPYALQGGVGVGDLLLSVTILTRSKDSPGIAATIKALAEAEQKKD